MKPDIQVQNLEHECLASLFFIGSCLAKPGIWNVKEKKNKQTGKSLQMVVNRVWRFANTLRVGVDPIDCHHGNGQQKTACHRAGSQNGAFGFSNGVFAPRFGLRCHYFSLKPVKTTGRKRKTTGRSGKPQGGPPCGLGLARTLPQMRMRMDTIPTDFAVPASTSWPAIFVAPSKWCRRSVRRACYTLRHPITSIAFFTFCLTDFSGQKQYLRVKFSKSTYCDLWSRFAGSCTLGTDRLLRPRCIVRRIT